MAASADLVVNIVTKLAGDGLKEADKQTSKFKKGLGTASKFAGAALVGIGAAAVGAANAAAEDAKSQTLLATAMKNGADASKGQISATEDWIDAQSRATGITDDELRPALAQLVHATGDVGKAQKLAALAMDVSAGTGKSLESVTQALVKAQNGSVGGLARLGVATKTTTKDTEAAAAAQLTAKKAQLAYSEAVKAHGKHSAEAAIAQQAMVDANNKAKDSADKTKTTTKSLADITKDLSKQYDGAAKAAGDTAAGKMERFKVSLGETQEAIGGALLPVLDKLSGVLMTVGQWAQDHGTMFAVIAGTVAVFAAAIIALNLAVTIYTAVTTLAGSATLVAWGAVLLPILAVIAVVAAVVVVVVLLWKKNEAFRGAILAIWGGIKSAVSSAVDAFHNVMTAASNVFSWIKSHWQMLSAILLAPIQAAAGAASTAFDKIKAAAQTVLGWIKSAWNTTWGLLRSFAETEIRGVQNIIHGLENVARSVLDGISSAIGKVGQAFQSPKAKITHAFAGAASWLYSIGASIVQGLINGIESLIGWVQQKVEDLAGKIPKWARKKPGHCSRHPR